MQFRQGRALLPSAYYVSDVLPENFWEHGTAVEKQVCRRGWIAWFGSGMAEEVQQVLGDGRVRRVRQAHFLDAAASVRGWCVQG